MLGAYKSLQKRLTRSANTQHRALREAMEIGSQELCLDAPLEGAPKARQKMKW
ncbi:unnamed protein product, partial [Effrenium voratum]